MASRVADHVPRYRAPIDVGNCWSALPAGSRHDFPADVTVFRQGDRVDAVFLIEAGAVKLVRSEASGDDAMAALRFPGSLLGVVSVVLDVPHPVSAVTIGRCELRRISAPEFRQEKARAAGLAAAVERALAAEIHEQVLRCGRSGMDARCRLLGVLLDLAQACGRRRPDGSTLLDVTLLQSDLASLALTSREHVNRLLSALAAEGRLRRERGWLVLPAARQPGRGPGGPCVR